MARISTLLKMVLLGCVMAAVSGAGSAPYSPVEDAFDKMSSSRWYHRKGSYTCSPDVIVSSVSCTVSRENGYVIGLGLNYMYEGSADFCNVDHQNADLVEVHSLPGEAIVGLKVCKGRYGGIKKVLIIKDSGAVTTCGNTDRSVPAYEYDWNQYGKRTGYRVGQATKTVSHRSFGLGMKGESKEQMSCTYWTPKIAPNWAKSFTGKPWMAHGIADHLSYTVDGKSYQKHAWTGPYTKTPAAVELHDAEQYDGYFKHVHPLSDIKASCNPSHGNSLWDLKPMFNKCYLPEHAHIDPVEVELTATMSDFISCADVDLAKSTLMDVMTAGVAHASGEQHLAIEHDFICNDVTGNAKWTTTVYPHGHLDAKSLHAKLQVLAHSDICEAATGSNNGLLHMFCKNSYDRDLNIEVGTAEESYVQVSH